MKVVHRIGFRASSQQLAALAALGVNRLNSLALPGEALPLVTFDVSEDHPRWNELVNLLAAWKVSDVVHTEFSTTEKAAAPHLCLAAQAKGYPEPDSDSFGYRAVTHDLRGFCATCGAGLIQNAPFRMRGEPRWGRSAMLQLNWVNDELFVRPELWNEVFRPRGIAKRIVLTSSGAELQTVVQVLIDEEVGVRASALRTTRCSACNRTRSAPVSRGFFPALDSCPSGSIARTREYFGSGAAAWKMIVINQSLYQDLLRLKVRNFAVTPFHSTAD